RTDRRLDEVIAVCNRALWSPWLQLTVQYVLTAAISEKPRASRRKSQKSAGATSPRSRPPGRCIHAATRRPGSLEGRGESRTPRMYSGQLPRSGQHLCIQENGGALAPQAVAGGDPLGPLDPLDRSLQNTDQLIERRALEQRAVVGAGDEVGVGRGE